MTRFRNAVSPSNNAGEKEAELSAQNGADHGNANFPYVHPKAFRPVGALHCTLGVMSLNKDELECAIKLLESLDVVSMFKHAVLSTSAVPSSSSVQSNAENSRQSFEGSGTQPTAHEEVTPLKINLKGLKSMHAAQKTSILYVEPFDATNRLYAFCLAVQKLFKDNDFLIVDDRDLKLHATVVNTIYAKGRKRPARHRLQQGTLQTSTTSLAGNPELPDDRAQGHGPNADAPLKIDATTLLEKYKDFEWAKDVVLDRVAICEMGAKKTFDAPGQVADEQYTEVANAKLPS